ncbi:MAG: CPBP family intramembrane metalloprotease [Planctomycetes bacterium]|nr:CPBP family intramembrane metalloprotease [Planctomycetota bacterium]
MTSDAPDRPASLRLLAAALGAYSLAHLFNNSVLELAGPKQALEALQHWSGGWIEPVLVRSQVVLLAFLVVVVGFGKRRFAGLGWRAGNVLPGLVTYVGAWLALQLVLAGAVLAQGQALELHPKWTQLGVAAVLGGVVAQACGHALVEDTAFRAFFLPELRARSVRVGFVLAPLLAVALALFGSALLFGLAHLPTRALVKSSGWSALAAEQWNFLSAGLALGLAFVVTRNLFVVIGLHVLLNDPAPLVSVSAALLNRGVLVVFAGVLVATLLRARAARRRVPLAEENSSASRRAA